MNRIIPTLLIVLALAIAAIVVQTVRLAAAHAQTDAAVLRGAAAAVSAAEWEAATYEAAIALSTCQTQWADVQQRGTAALAQAQRQRDIALDALDQWRTRWDAITSDCSAALAATDAACGELEGY